MRSGSGETERIPGYLPQLAENITIKHLKTEHDMSKNEYFPTVKKIEYKGPDSRDPLSFAYYDENQAVAGTTMMDHFRVAIAYWHTFCNEHTNLFGEGTRSLPRDK